MPRLTRRLIRDLVRARSVRRWERLADDIDRMPLANLRGLDDEARTLRRSLNRIVARSNARLDLHRPGAEPLDLPSGTTWRWRPQLMAARTSPRGIAAPESGTRLAEEAAIWHDCPERALVLRQMRNSRSAELSPYGLLLEILGFSGSFLSISIDLPQAALNGLTRSRIVRLASVMSVERPMNIYARLNVGHGPNTDQLLRHLGDLQPGRTTSLVTEFDMFRIEMNEKRLEKIWLDLIFESPHMNAVRIGDLFLSHHPRAEV
ncbi:DUF6478 family protein [Paracoccus aeridis]|uniref:DUF6478 family protein n=1 Tax=Paracoccus aeridis TaxID=1966466 RepID=UPI0010AAD45D|nr:DUF6478 family protein [Paracoccus aeridis]